MNNSLIVSGTSNTNAESTKYQMGINPCVTLLLKLLIQKAIIDTSTTGSNKRDNLSSLDTYITKVKPDIEKFNEYAKINYEDLTTRGKRCNIIMSNVFKG